jgi:phospholipid/cholesterol/gamma-HCH transport system permease protein
VGKAATGAFVNSFVVILIIDLILGIFLNTVYYTLWPEAGKLF